MPKAITTHLNLNTLLIIALGFLANYYLHDIQKAMDQVRQNTTDIAIIQGHLGLETKQHVNTKQYGKASDLTE